MRDKKPEDANMAYGITPEENAICEELRTTNEFLREIVFLIKRQMNAGSLVEVSIDDPSEARQRDFVTPIGALPR